MYPDVINNIGEEEDILNQLTNSYLYKDVFAHYNIRKSEILEKLLQALALQVGSEVSYNELSSLLGIDKNTVSHYITILEQAYIIFKLPSFARNLRNEIKHNKKIYFYDNGIRNSIIGNFNAITNRQDIGALWENFLISERVKNNAYTKNKVHGYFWRTVQQQEIDYIEDYAGDIFAYEIKWNEKAKTKKHETFVKTYKASLEIITPNNFRTFIE